MEFCHAFDLSQCEKDASTLSNILSLSLPRDQFIATAVHAVSQFVALCNKEGIAGRIILTWGTIWATMSFLSFPMKCRCRCSTVSFRDFTFSFEGARAF